MKKIIVTAIVLGAAIAPTLANAGVYIPTCGYYTNLVWNGFAWVYVQQYVCG
ncbi:hypothetical protein [Mesorhizobium sp.]|uniref:hypothetical protein n=1 Tax=Mesorhizobium sp. TaxID=1871066 RepID=UPI001AD367EF|nr:hypothetical protein [Mesorhizobium sp.]MBN9257090.1 hypothetical protein [Mesorhizobium sp.]